METVKCVIVGDGAVGKTCMLISYTTGHFPEDYIPTVFDNYTANVMCDGKAVQLGLWDTAGQEDYDRLRPLSYPGTDVFLVCYSVDSKHSLQNVETKWLPELQKFAPDVPKILCATKADFRTNPPKKVSLVKKETVAQVVEENNLSAHFECSAKTEKGLKRVFDKAINIAIVKRKNERRAVDRRRNMCAIL